MRYEIQTHGVCARSVSFDLNNNVVTNISFVGGCNGNLKAIAKLCDGMNVSEISEKLQGNTCGMKSTSCADQLVRAIQLASVQNS